MSILRCKRKDDGYALHKKTRVPRNYPGRLLRLGGEENKMINWETIAEAMIIAGTFLLVNGFMIMWLVLC